MPDPSEPAPLTRAQVRRVDELAIRRHGIPGLTLMENAGRGAADLLRSFRPAGPVAVLCGKGNNGGDGFVIARRLAAAGVEVRALLFADSADLRGDAAAACDLARRAGVSPRPWAGAVDFDTLSAELSGAAWVVDALLGTGAAGLPRPPVPEAIRAVNAAAAAGVRVLAVDLPSGLDADAGVPFRGPDGRFGPCVRADVTATFVARKVGFLRPAAREFTGEVAVIDIGVPADVIAEAAAAPGQAAPAGSGGPGSGGPGSGDAGSGDAGLG